MSHQLTFADCEFNSKRRQTRKEAFFARMEALLPWPRMLAVIEPVYPKPGNGRRPYPLEIMLSIHCIAETIHQQGGDYLLAVKGNQPKLFEAVRQALAPLAATPLCAETMTLEKAHGRIDGT